jgi:tetratricopeptide (TPR) repeat protein
MWRTAISDRNAGRANEAEDMLHQVFLGMAHVLGKTNEDTVKAAYNLADLYADSGRMDEATAMIEKVIEYHRTTYGYEDLRTQQNVLHAVELLNG